MYVSSNYDQMNDGFDDEEFTELYEHEVPAVEPEKEDETIDPRRECAENLLWWLKALGAI